MSNEEEAIARAQAAAIRAEGTQGDALQRHHTRGIANIDERILIFVLALAVLGLLVLWATATSALVLYGSLAGVVLLSLLWGWVRIKRIEGLRRQRELEAQAWSSERVEK